MSKDNTLPQLALALNRQFSRKLLQVSLPKTFHRRAYNELLM